MNILNTVPLASLVVAALAVSQPIHAQDVFQTGETQLEYNYFQAQYVLDQDDFDYPFVFTLQLSVTPSIAFRVEYLNLSISEDVLDANNDNIRIKAEVAGAAAGFTYHRASERWPSIDWTAGLGYERVETKFSQKNTATGETTSLNDTVVSTAVATTLGVRASILPNLEAEAEVYSTYADGDFSDPSLDLNTVYRFSSHFDLSLSADDVIGDDPFYSVGLRYNW